MPFIDANRHLQAFNWGRFDQTVIGAGAAGILIALKLAAKGKRVLVIESGHFEPDDERQALNDIEETGKPLGDPRWVRKRIIGGTTTAWGGQSLPFMPIDFGKRDWLEESGWPIDIEDLRPHYESANAFMGIDKLNYDTDINNILSVRPPNFDKNSVHYYYSKWAREPNFFKLYASPLKTQITLLYNAQLLAINVKDNGPVDSIEVANFQGENRRSTVENLILAVGGIETNRTLLLNDHQQKGGLGSQGGWLGRAFMEHPSIDAGVVTTSDMYRLQACLGTRLKGGRRYSSQMGASPVWQTKNRLLNIKAGMMWRYDDGSVSPLTHLRAFVRRPSLAQAAELTRNSSELAQGLYTLATAGVVYKPGATPTLALSCEQEPSRDSYIGLGATLDRFGLRQAQLNWKISYKTWETVVRFGQTLEGELPRAGLGAVKLFGHIRLDQADWEQRLSDVNHHMGGARMSADAKTGVVDTNLQVWGVPNLYVCSAAVFPTGFHSNPTLTVLALGARLADRLAAA